MTDTQVSGVSVEQLAGVLGVTVERLLTQLNKAGVEVASAEPYPAKLGAKINLTGVEQLVAGPKFDLWLGDTWPTQGLTSELVHVIPLTGTVAADRVAAQAGECLVCSPGAEVQTASGTQLLIAQARSEDRAPND